MHDQMRNQMRNQCAIKCASNAHLNAHLNAQNNISGASGLISRSKSVVCDFVFLTRFLTFCRVKIWIFPRADCVDRQNGECNKKARRKWSKDPTHCFLRSRCFCIENRNGFRFFQICATRACRTLPHAGRDRCETRPPLQTSNQHRNKHPKIFSHECARKWRNQMRNQMRNQVRNQMRNQFGRSTSSAHEESRC